MIDLEKLKEYASNLLPINIIAVLLDVNEYEFRDMISDRKSEVSRTYYRGQAETIAAIRKQEIELAKTGSPLSVENIESYIIEQKISENG